MSRCASVASPLLLFHPVTILCAPSQIDGSGTVASVNLSEVLSGLLMKELAPASAGSSSAAGSSSSTAQPGAKKPASKAARRTTAAVPAPAAAPATAAPSASGAALTDAQLKALVGDMLKAQGRQDAATKPSEMLEQCASYFADTVRRGAVGCECTTCCSRSCAGLYVAALVVSVRCCLHHQRLQSLQFGAVVLCYLISLQRHQHSSWRPLRQRDDGRTAQVSWACEWLVSRVCLLRSRWFPRASLERVLSPTGWFSRRAWASVTSLAASLA